MARFKRSRYIVKLGLQMRYMGVILISLLLVAMVVGWTIYFTIWQQISDPMLTNEQLIDIFSRGNEILLWKMMVAIVFICFISIFVSHKIAGPVFRFEQSARAISDGDLSYRIKLRKGDELHELAVAFNGMTESLESIVKENNIVLTRMNAFVDKAKIDFEKKSLSSERKKEILTELSFVQSELVRITETFKTEVEEIEEIREEIIIVEESAEVEETEEKTEA